jgi:hypothetical protein
MDDRNDCPQAWANSLRDPISMEKSWVWGYTPVIPATVGSLKQENCKLGWPEQTVRPYLKKKKPERKGLENVAQVCSIPLARVKP